MPKEANRIRKKRARKNLGFISRREFALASLGALSVSSMTKGTGAVAKMATKPAHIPSLSPGARTFNLIFDKWDYRIQVEPEWTLQAVLCDELRAVSIRDVCDGTWRSCSVAVDGKPVLFCTRSPAITQKA